jgi:hypothetical protein
MFRQIPFYCSTGIDADAVSGVLNGCALRETAAHRQILYTLNRGLPRGKAMPTSRTLSVMPGLQTPFGGRTFTVNFHS